MSSRTLSLYGVILATGLLGPFIAPDYIFQFAVLWIMILLAATWDMMGGQMGYNSLGNILFFGVGMYASAVVQIGLYFDVSEYTSAHGAVVANFDEAQYFTGLFLGMIVGGVGAAISAVLIGFCVFGLRGPYFAIGTLGVALAAAELVGGWDYLGGGSGISMPVYPGEPDDRSVFFYFLCFVLTALCHIFLRWLYSTRYGLAMNAIRDDEDKADAMGIHCRRYKTVTWAMSAFFVGISGAIFGNMIGFIEPLEVAFPTTTFGIFMVAMALLGGKGTLWGPVLGATLFHIVKEVTWTYLLGWQWVALGALIIVNIVFFQQGILGWAQEKWPEYFGLRVDPARRTTAEAAE